MLFVRSFVCYGVSYFGLFLDLCYFVFFVYFIYAPVFTEAKEPLYYIILYYIILYYIILYYIILYYIILKNGSLYNAIPGI